MKNLARQFDGTKKQAPEPKKDEYKFVRGAKVRVVEQKDKAEGKAT
jgi:hypothetical protein